MQRLSRIVGLGYIAICLATLAGTVLFGPLGYAPLPLVAGPARAPIVVTIWYGTEKKEWLEAARTRFEATQPVLGGPSGWSSRAGAATRRRPRSARPAACGSSS